METGLIVGLLMFLVSAICSGAFAFPQKFVKKFTWENTWGSFWFFTMIVIPAIVTPFLLQNVLDTWSFAGSMEVIKTVLFGSLWGLGCVTFGIGISMIGLSLGYSIIMGLAIGVGSFLPMIVFYPQMVNTPAGYVSIAGIIVSVLGVALCGYAGVLKERSMVNKESTTKTDQQGRPITKGMLICVLSGFFSACLNLGFAFAQEITRLASDKFGNPPWCAGLVTWILLFAGGFIICGPVCVIIFFNRQ